MEDRKAPLPRIPSVIARPNRKERRRLKKLGFNMEVVGELPPHDRRELEAAAKDVKRKSKQRRLGKPIG